MATIVRKERTYGTIGRRSNAAKDESLEDFLKDFSASVAQAAVVTVKEGKGAYHAEIPAAGTELEKQLKVKAKKAGGPAPKEDAFVKPQVGAAECLEGCSNG